MSLQSWKIFFLFCFMSLAVQALVKTLSTDSDLPDLDSVIVMEPGESYLDRAQHNLRTMFDYSTRERKQN